MPKVQQFYRANKTCPNCSSSCLLCGLSRTEYKHGQLHKRYLEDTKGHLRIPKHDYSYHEQWILLSSFSFNKNTRRVLFVDGQRLPFLRPIEFSK